MGAARDLRGAPRFAAYAAGQAAVVAHLAEHDLVLDDQRRRNAICCNVFDA